MRIVMLGTGPYAVPLLSQVDESSHQVAALFTRPERQRDSVGAILPSPMRQRAEQSGTPIYAPEDINHESSHNLLTELHADLFVVCDYGQILSPSTLGLAPRGGLNLHASLLPKYRGAAPIHWAIYHGASETGNTVIQMNAGMDAGPIVAQESIAIGPEETTPELEVRLAERGSLLVLEVIEKLGRGDLQSRPQDLQAMTAAPKLKKADGHIDWNRSARAIKNQIRAMVPWPRTFTHYLPAEGRPQRVIIAKAAVLTEKELPEYSASSTPAGTVLQADRDCLLIETGQDLLQLLQLQPAGKKMLAADEFLRGYRPKVGDRFGSFSEAP